MSRNTGTPWSAGRLGVSTTTRRWACLAREAKQDDCCHRRAHADAVVMLMGFTETRGMYHIVGSTYIVAMDEKRKTTGASVQRSVSRRASDQIQTGLIGCELA